MKKNILKSKTAEVKNETTAALQIIWDATNNGQRAKLLRDERIAKLLKRYRVNTDG